MIVKEGSDDDMLTDEEKKLAQRIGIISLGLTKTQYTKQLSGNKNQEAK